MNKQHLTEALDGIDDEYMNILCGGERGKLLQAAISLVNISVDDDVEKITPPPNLLFNAFRLCKFNDLKCVIVGQDPYPKKGDAMGLSFSAPSDRKVPVSLKKIYEALIEAGEMEDIPKSPDLTSWAKQGVLLLNMSLTTEIGASKAHENYWKNYVPKMILELSKTMAEKGNNIIWMLWGSSAQTLSDVISMGNKQALIFKWGHPSPLNNANKTDNPANFKYCDHFTKTNIELVKRAPNNRRATINWDPTE